MKPNRNDPCPCGSGRKYKNCCESTARPDRPANTTARQRKLGALAIVLALAAIPLVILSTRGGGAGDDDPAQQPAALQPQAPNPQQAQPEPEPWEYDPQLNRHWHPREQQWQFGPPPDGALEAEDPTQFVEQTPEPWFYDEENDRHWNPTPGHAHWHRGPPPPPDQRR